MLSNLATLLLAALEVFKDFRSMIPNPSLIFGQLPFTSIQILHHLMVLRDKVSEECVRTFPLRELLPNFSVPRSIRLLEVWGLEIGLHGNPCLL